MTLLYLQLTFYFLYDCKVHIDEVFLFLNAGNNSVSGFVGLYYFAFDLSGLADKMFTFFPGYFEVLTATTLIHLFLTDLCIDPGNVDSG